MTNPASPIDRLRLALPSLPPRLREAGRFVARNDFDAATRSMREIAATAGASPATFTRLAQALGYSGWDALRDALIETRRPAAKAPFSRRAQRGQAQAASLSHDMLAADVAVIGALDPLPVRAAAEAMKVAPRLWIAGFRSCHAVAMLLHYELRLFRSGFVHLVGATAPEDLDLSAFQPGDAVVVVAFAPYARLAVMTARAAMSAGAVLIALADTPAAPIAEGADHLLLFQADAGPGFFPCVAGAVSLVQALAAELFALGGSASLTRLRETEARLAEYAQYVYE